MPSIRKYLSMKPVVAAAPCRIDSGGTWDIKALALPLQGISPVTVNIALDVRTKVRLLPYSDGKVKVASRGFSHGKAFAAGGFPFGPPFGLFLAAASFFEFHGFEADIESESPVKSGLGGSSTALVALIKALGEVRERAGGKKLSSREILHLAYHLEDGVSGGNCGIQDQAAAVYGGVHKWIWRHGKPEKPPFERSPLLDSKGRERLSKRLLVAYSGKSHVSTRTNKKWIGDFLSGRTRNGWIKANEIVHKFAQAIGEEDWDGAAALLREETALRKDITPEALIPETSVLIDLAEDAGCGARFAGAGAGGSIWALGEEKNIQGLRNLWQKALKGMRNGRIIECRVDSKGVR